MKFKKTAVLAMCTGLVLCCSSPSAHGHHNGYGHHGSYSYYGGYNYDGYNYGCGNHPEHAHPDGVCPYNSTDPAYHCYRASTVKKVQKKLNKLGYNCGSADGVYGTRTKNCIKKFQKKKNMAVNGKITQSLLKKLKC